MEKINLGTLLQCKILPVSLYVVLRMAYLHSELGLALVWSEAVFLLHMLQNKNLNMKSVARIHCLGEVHHYVRYMNITINFCTIKVKLIQSAFKKHNFFLVHINVDVIILYESD